MIFFKSGIVANMSLRDESSQNECSCTEYLRIEELQIEFEISEFEISLKILKNRKFYTDSVIKSDKKLQRLRLSLFKIKVENESFSKCVKNFFTNSDNEALYN